MQEGRFFHGYYDDYCYLPLYAFCGRHLLLARQRRANVAGSAGAVEEVARIVAQIRHKWRKVRIVLRADSGFANEELMAWCEANRVGYVFGLARNSRLEAALAAELAAAKCQHLASGAPARVFRDFRYRTLDSWSRRRRARSTRTSTAPAARPRTASASSSNCLPIGRRPPPCRPISCACGSPPWPMFWSTACAASACAILSSPMPPLRPSGSSCSSSALRSAAACAASTSRSHQAARTRSNSKWPI